jgi:restriction system protein
MARKKNDFLTLLLRMPWWVDLLLGFIGYLLLKWIIPGLAVESPIARSLLSAIPILAPMFLALCAFCAVASACINFNGRKLLRHHQRTGNLSNVSWHDFEFLVEQYYQDQGYVAQRNFGFGPDGGIDVRASKGATKILIQCKHWRTKNVGVATVREMYGLMVGEGFDQAHIVASGGFTKEAEAFAYGKPVQLITADMLRSRHKPSAATASKPQVVMPPDTCARCGSGMVKRTAKRGANAGNEFWGCSTFPTCRNIVGL